MKIDLYRLFFPAGFALGFWGASVWVLYYFNFIAYPGRLHPEIMMGGFLLSFVLGFLCTAVPKFTDSFPPTPKEFFVAALLITFLFFAQVISNTLLFRACSLAIFIYLAIFVVRRFIKRKANPPAPFIFIGIGLVSGLLGSSFLLLSQFNLVGSNTIILGRLFIYQGYILSMVLGVGSRLIPSLLGLAPPPDQAQKGLSVKTYLILGLIFLATYFLEAFVAQMAGMLLRDFILIFIAFVPWKIYKIPTRVAIHSYGLWISCWFLILGHVGASLFSNYKVHFMHLFYIGGLSLMTMLIASRVILSHGGHGTQMELKSKHLLGPIGLLVLAALTRFSAGIIPEVYQSFLLYAAVAWIAGIVWWGSVFIPKIFYVKRN